MAMNDRDLFAKSHFARVERADPKVCAILNLTFPGAVPPLVGRRSPRFEGINTSHQNSNQDGTRAVKAPRRCASRGHWSRLSKIWLMDAESSSFVLRASSSIARSCSTSVRSQFSSMSNSFISRRITGSGSGASHGWGASNGIKKG
jgi:hypothetical protein